MTSEEFLAEFPHGARVSDPSNGILYNMISLEAVDSSVVGGYVSPNKAIFIDASSARPKADGVLVDSTRGTSRPLYMVPLTSAEGAYAEDAAKDD